MRHLAITLVIGTMVALAVISGRPTKAADAPAAASKVRIGVYDSRAVALAWGRSKACMDNISARMAEHKKAKAAGDTKQADKIGEEMKVLQDKMHWQVFGDWNIDDILVKIRPNYPDIAKKAGVIAIVPRLEYKDASIEAVDVTMLMAEQFSPDEKTKQIMGEMSKNPPLPFEQMRQVKPED
jgi:hypothetical protein